MKQIQLDLLFTILAAFVVLFGGRALVARVGFLKRFSIYALVDYKAGAFLFNQQERSRCQTANDNCERVNNPRARFPQTPADSVLFKELASIAIRRESARNGFSHPTS